jgi:hypothetical protein
MRRNGAQINQKGAIERLYDAVRPITPSFTQQRRPVREICRLAIEQFVLPNHHLDGATSLTETVAQAARSRRPGAAARVPRSLFRRSAQRFARRGQRHSGRPAYRAVARCRAAGSSAYCSTASGQKCGERIAPVPPTNVRRNVTAETRAQHLAIRQLRPSQRGRGQKRWATFFPRLHRRLPNIVQRTSRNIIFVSNPVRTSPV